MKIIPKRGVLLVVKHKTTALKADIVVEEVDNDKRLITGTIIECNDSINYKKGETVIFGKYALFQLTITGVDYFFLSEDDVISTCDYNENV